MTFDYRASQLRTSKIIASGSTGTRAQILLYPIAAQGSPLNQGNINPALLGTGSIGNDVFFFVSGAIGGIDQSTNGISLFGGDIFSSGSIKAAQNLHAKGTVSFQSNGNYSGFLTASLTDDRVWIFPDEIGDVVISSRVLAGDGIVVNPYDGGYVGISSSATPTSRMINVASPLSGGGNLTSDVNIALNQTLLSISASQISNATSFGIGFVTASNGSSARQHVGIQDMARILPLGINLVTTITTGDLGIGGGYFDPNAWSITGRTTSVSFEAVGQVVSGVTGTLTLYNITSGSSAAVLTWTETDYTVKSSSLSIPGSASIYELRFKKTGGATDDFAVVLGAQLKISWS